jgi:hypothetical protein
MDKESLVEMLFSAEQSLEAYYISGSDYDIEATERFCADIERRLVSLSD